jgi:hypothetical protein
MGRRSQAQVLAGFRPPGGNGVNSSGVNRRPVLPNKKLPRVAGREFCFKAADYFLP